MYLVLTWASSKSVISQQVFLQDIMEAQLLLYFLQSHILDKNMLCICISHALYTEN